MNQQRHCITVYKYPSTAMMNSVILVCLVIALTFGMSCGKPDRPTISLLQAVADNNIQQVKSHIYWGCDVNASDENGWAPLHFAAKRGLTDLARLLLDNGAFVDATDRDGWTPLYVAASEGQMEVSILLLQKGANPNAHVRSDGKKWTPMHAAVYKKHADIVNLLAENGADCNAVAENRDRTPIGMAIQQQNIDAVRVLLSHGVDPRQGLYHLMQYRQSSYPDTVYREMMKMLLAAAENVNRQDADEKDMKAK